MFQTGICDTPAFWLRWCSETDITQLKQPCILKRIRNYYPDIPITGRVVNASKKLN